MKINIEINRMAKSPLPAAFVKRIAAAVIEAELVGKVAAEKIELSIVFAGAAKIRQINKNTAGLTVPPMSYLLKGMISPARRLIIRACWVN